jgi:TRAP-type C4-dicarboxylate transport system permease small subunit
MVRIIDFCFLVLKAAIAALLAAMVVLVFGNVVLRYAFNTGITYSEELSPSWRCANMGISASIRSCAACRPRLPGSPS